MEAIGVSLVGNKTIVQKKIKKRKRSGDREKREQEKRLLRIYVHELCVGDRNAPREGQAYLGVKSECENGERVDAATATRTNGDTNGSHGKTRDQ